MKKMNKKGFTLIELLAVIVVLAIVMVIATTTVLSSTGKATGNAFVQSARTIADFINKQNQLMTFQANGENNESCYNTWSGKKSGTDITNIKLNANSTAATCFGINSTDYDITTSSVSIDANGVVSVTLCPTSSGKFAGLKANDSYDGITVDANKCVTVSK